MKFLLTILLIITFDTGACTFTMAYRLSERLPLINATPNNDGLYKDLFSTALKKINCKLTIIREPKKRIIKKLVDGSVDFYPGFTFSYERSNYVYFFENGLETSFLAISSLKQPNIENIAHLSSKILLVAHGGPTLGAENVGAIIRYVEDLTIEEAIGYLISGKGDFYLYPKASIDYYLKNNPEEEIKRHACCGEPTNMFLGFSKNSSHFLAQKNSIYDDIDKANNTIELAEHSKAFALQQVIQQMKVDGTISKLYKKYYQ